MTTNKTNNPGAVTLHRVEGAREWWQAIGETKDEWVAATGESIVEVET